MSHLKRLIHAIHRRSLWLVLLIYIGAAWVCFELIEAVTERLAIDQLECLPSIPFPVSAPLPKADRLCDPLRDHPRFQALLEKREGNRHDDVFTSSLHRLSRVGNTRKGLQS